MNNFFITVLVIGLSGLVAQGLVLRELLVSFYGNELTLGITLANWILCEAIGVFFLGKLVDRVKNKINVFIILQLIFSLSLPFSIYFAKAFKSMIGIAFGQNSDITGESADAVIMDSSLLKVDELFHIGKRMRKIALQSAVGGMALSLIGMMFAGLGYLTPVAGAITQEIIDVFAVLNALRAAVPPKSLSDFLKKGTPKLSPNPEMHRSHRIGWLRAAVLGANDGIVSTASLILGIAASQATHNDIVLAGIAGLVAGAMSMAAGEYVSVSSQADTEQADLKREHKELNENEQHEKNELASIYVSRGLEPLLAEQVAEQLMKHDALGAHARDELGISATVTAKPIQAALTSATTFAVGAVLPLLMVMFAPVADLIVLVSFSSLLFLTLLGMLSAGVTASVKRGELSTAASQTGIHSQSWRW